MFFPTGLVALILNLISGYALKQSLTSISNVKIYEDKAEKAADWSNTAKTRLWDTRYTIGAGFVSVSTIALSLFTAHVSARVVNTVLTSSQVPRFSYLGIHLFTLCVFG